MSGVAAVPAPGGYGLFSSLLADSTDLSQRLAELTRQASSGLLSNDYAGLGAGASVSLDLNPEISRLETWQNNIASATGSADVTQTAMGQIQQVAAKFYADINNLNGLNPSEVDSVAAEARDALAQVAGLLDTQDASRYVFAGADSANAPVPNPQAILSSGFYSQIAAAVGNLGAAGGAATAAATLAVASSNAPGTSPFSANLSQPAVSLVGTIPTVETGNGQCAPIGLLASANTAITSAGASTTGSYMRDLLRSLATLGSLSSAQVNLPGFASLVADTSTSLQGAITAMAGDAGVLGNRQAELTATQTRLADTATALSAQVSTAQNVDMAQTLSAITQTQTQLQASYQVIAGISGLSLAKLLPIGA